MRPDDTSWCLTKQAVGVRKREGGGEGELVLSLLPLPSRSVAALAGTEAALWSAR